MSEESVYRKLYQGVRSRYMPETVAGYLAELPEIVRDTQILKLVKQRTGRRRSSMPESWFQPVDLRKKILVAQALFEDQIKGANDPRAHISPDESDPEIIGEFLQYLNEKLHKSINYNSFKHNRWNREHRAELEIEYGNHAYNKRFRLLSRMADHLDVYRKEKRLVSYRLAGKVGLVADLEFDEFRSDPWTAAFVAYYAARKARRSVFTNAAQERPFDDLCAALLRNCENRSVNWEVIARVFPDPAILQRLDDEALGRLLGHWLLYLRDLAEDLDKIWRTSDINLETMVVKRGNDSSTWNLSAQAWNSARTGWLAFTQAMGAENIIEKFLPGKVLRLIAGDVAAWHASTSGGIHQDTLIWRELPFPWSVMRGEAFCDKRLIEATCQRFRVDPVQSGWCEANVSRKTVRYRPTPELVHGVEISSPEMAGLLRKLGWFSGKQ